MHRIIQERLTEISAICRRYRVRSLEVFGSAAGARFDPETSDIDFVVEFMPMLPAEHAKAYLGLAEDLEHLFGRPVDLVEPSAIRNPFFRQSVDETQVLVYAAA